MKALSLAAAVLAGVLTAVGGYTFLYAKGYSYASNDPAVCATLNTDHAEGADCRGYFNRTKVKPLTKRASTLVANSSADSPLLARRRSDVSAKSVFDVLRRSLFRSCENRSAP